MALFCWGMALYALKTGTLIMKGRYDKIERPLTYWFGVVCYLVLGVFVVVKGFVT